MKKRLFLTFDQPSLDTPILSILTARFGLLFNIFGATVNENEQFVALELEGDDARILAAIEYLMANGVRVDIRDH